MISKSDVMEKRKIPVIALAIFSIAILLANNNIEKAFALSHVDVAVALDMTTNNNAISYAGGSLFVLGKFNNTGLNNTPIYKINPVTGVIITSNNLSGKQDGLVCSSSFCVTVFQNGAGQNRVIEKISLTTLAITATSVALASNIEAQSLDISGSNIYYTRLNAGTVSIGIMNSVDMAETAIYSSGMGAVSVKDLKVISSQNRIAVTTDSHNFHLWNTQTASQVCQLGASGSYLNAGQITYDANNNRYFVTSDTTNKINVISSACALSTTITGFGEANYSVGIQIDTARSEIFVLTSSDTTSKIVALKYSDFTKKWEYLSVGKSFRDFLAYDSSNKIIMVGSASNLIRLITLDSVGEGSITGSQVCIDTTGDAETDLCFTDTNGDGVPDAGQAGALGAYRGSANVTKFGTDLGCAFGLTSCTNKDIKTNGVGLFYLMIIIIWSYAALVFIHYEAKKLGSAGNVHVTEVLNINPILLVVMLFIDVGITFYLGWIPDLIFYSAVVGVIGIASFGIYRHLRGG